MVVASVSERFKPLVINKTNVEYKTLEGGIGYISMAQFTANARDQVDDALAALRAIVRSCSTPSPLQLRWHGINRA